MINTDDINVNDRVLGTSKNNIGLKGTVKNIETIFIRQTKYTIKWDNGKDETVTLSSIKPDYSRMYNSNLNMNPQNLNEIGIARVNQISNHMNDNENINSPLTSNFSMSNLLDPSVNHDQEILAMLSNNNDDNLDMDPISSSSKSLRQKSEDHKKRKREEFSYNADLPYNSFHELAPLLVLPQYSDLRGEKNKRARRRCRICKANASYFCPTCSDYSNNRIYVVCNNHKYKSGSDCFRKHLEMYQQ